MNDFNLIVAIITIVCVLAGIMGVCAYLIWVERKIAAYVQDRIGPNRVGPFGLLQPLADGLKFLFKEDIIPAKVDKVLFLTAPVIAVSTALFAFVVVPFGPTTPLPRPPAPLSPYASPEQQTAYQQQEQTYQQDLQEYHSRYQFVIAPHVDIGIVFIFAITSLTVYAIILGGWASNNKYSFIGGLRSSAQLLSYEIPMGMSILGVALLSGSLNLERIMQQQADHVWYIFFQPLAFLLFLISAYAECNRLPFDLPEAEQELVGGYHTEYSAMKFALFFLGEYAHVITTSFLMSILFLGGWHFPGIPQSGALAIALKLLVLYAKVVFFILLYMMVRWTLPRFRFDQLMQLAWKGLIPLALANLVLVLIVKQLDLNLWWLLPASLIVLVAGAAPSLWTYPRPPGRTTMVTQT
ncbi:MAG: NADH-quinone oxidoreductase subunit NuoH, partial [Planctomycetes bacterium]|nr:NADH-quinone oxidoreductase subunit NuoH [Planctomycetota bacterium]